MSEEAWIAGGRHLTTDSPLGFPVGKWTEYYILHSRDVNLREPVQENHHNYGPVPAIERVR